MDIEQILQHSATCWPDRPAFIEEEGIVSYRALYQQCAQLKKTLSDAGLRQGQGLGVMGRNSSHFVLAMFAGMACGAAVMPLSNQLTQAEMATILRNTGLHAIIDDLHGIQPTLGKRLSLEVARHKWRYSRTDIEDDRPISKISDAAFIRYTSGTTGVSQGVLLTRQRIMERLETAQQVLQITADDTVLWVLPMAFHFLVTIMVYLRYGATIIICRDLLSHTIIDNANRYRATLLYAAPMHIRLLAADKSDIRMPTIKRAISTSSSIAEPLAKQFFKRFKLPVSQAYGIIEAGLPLLDNHPVANSCTSVGPPAPGFEIAILDNNHTPVIRGKTGQLALRGPGMFNAYLQPWRLCEEVMCEGWFMTGDLAYFREEGRVVICGRKKTMINVSGNKAFPEEIEAVLNSHPAIRDARVYGREHPLMGEIVCADIILTPGKRVASEAIIHYCRQRLSTYKVPQRIQQVLSIPHTLSGKIKRTGS